jgi:signal transduction histidine kinase
MPTQPAASTPPPGLGLLWRLGLVLIALALCLFVLLWAWLEPRNQRAFERLGSDLLTEMSSTMQGLAYDQTDRARDLLIDLARADAIARERSLRTLPLVGDVEAIRSAVAADDRTREANQQRHVVVKADELQRSMTAAVDGRLSTLAQAQQARTKAFVQQQRRSHLWLVAAVGLGLLVVLGFLLRQLVVAPVQRLQRATRAVANGDLAIALPTPPGGELGALTADFERMLGELRRSRRELERLSAGLADEVSKKTAHLQQALLELRASHRQLAQAERLASLGTLAGGIAHEFQNVIGGIRGCANELLAENGDAATRDTLGVIVRAADRGAGIVQQLLRFARRSPERVADLDPAALAEDALRLCEPAARRQQVRVERRLANGLALRGDGDGLHQVLVNLLINAVQAMPNGGELRVAVDGDDANVRIAITDTGSGIAEADLPHLFEPFFTTKTSGSGPRGSGLGLSVSWGIVEAHGGRIDVQSQVGRGTTFTVMLPRSGR